MSGEEMDSGLPDNTPPAPETQPENGPAAGEIVYWAYDHFALPLPPRHRYPRNRFARVRQALLAGGAVNEARILPARAEDWELLELVHEADYLQAVRTGALSAAAIREIGIPFSTALVERARAAVFATRSAAHRAMTDGAGAVIGGGTHHAFAGRGAGYCLFNDVAVAIRDLQRLQPQRPQPQRPQLHSRHRIQRAAIVDLDVHQGNGSADIFAADPGVFTFSIHGEKNWPYRKARGDFDLGLPDGTGDAEYLAALEPPLRDMLDTFRPELVFYLAGADPLHSDRLGRLAMTLEGLRQRDRLVLNLCAERAIPVTITMGGGYGMPIEDTIAVHLNTVREIERVWGKGIS